MTRGYPKMSVLTDKQDKREKMTDDFFMRESSKLSFAEIMYRLAECEDTWDSNASYAGVYRQIKAQGLESLTAKQRWIYENELKPMSVEKCEFQGICERPAFPGKYCDMHEQKFGS